MQSRQNCYGNPLGVQHESRRDLEKGARPRRYHSFARRSPIDKLSQDARSSEERMIYIFSYRRRWSCRCPKDTGANHRAEHKPEERCTWGEHYSFLEIGGSQVSRSLRDGYLAFWLRVVRSSSAHGVVDCIMGAIFDPVSITSLPMELPIRIIRFRLQLSIAIEESAF